MSRARQTHTSVKKINVKQKEDTYNMRANMVVSAVLQ